MKISKFITAFVVVAALIFPHSTWAVTYSRPTFNWLVPLVDILALVMLVITAILGIVKFFVRHQKQPQGSSTPAGSLPPPISPRNMLIIKLFRVSLFVMLGVFVLYFIFHFFPITTDVVAG